jgi:CRISPR-associated protein Cmr2
MKNTNDYLMAISIGPVQDFIASARRLRDLWFGSYLLSELAKKGAHSLYLQHAELIFPNIDNAQIDLAVGSEMKVPNKLLAKITSGTPRNVFQTVKSDILSFWKDDLAMKTLDKKDLDRVNINLFKEQMDDFLEIYGAWVPVNDDYKTSRKRVEQILSARKTIRIFNQPIPVQTGKGGLPKSSLDGIRESVLSDHQRMQGKRGLKDGEELDAVGWVKRYGQQLGQDEKSPVFESLSDLAADPFLRGAMKKPDAEQSMRTLIDTINSAGIKIDRVADREHRRPLSNLSPRILYPFSLKKELEEIDLDSNTVTDIVKKVRIVHAISGMKQGPLPYTAILLGDGDAMGQTINNLDAIEPHRRLSGELDRFARACRAIVEKHYGSLIYSGGDDVLAFVPLDQAIECADALRQQFSSCMHQLTKDADASPTLSIGIAIVHHLRPMNLSLDLARRAERRAKSVKGKNALAVILDKRSGAPLYIADSWKNDIAQRLINWAQFHQEDLIPDKFGYQLRHLAHEFGQDGALAWTADGLPDNALAYEFVRVLKRKRSGQGKHELKHEQLEHILHTARYSGNLKHLADELVLSRIIADAKNQAK